jgi:alpha-N-arabinofuranosidase
MIALLCLSIGPAVGAWAQGASGTVKATIAIDAQSKAEPISPYIYGQFIEHLGRCVYGGIWAEMLEDRKFYYPITANYKPYVPSKAIPSSAPFQVVGASPWQIIGSADSVTMVREDPFVGEHSPLIQAGSGIRQLDLGLVKGKAYTGYIYLRASQGNPSVTVSLVWGDNQRNSMRFGAIEKQYVKHPFWLTSGADTTHGKLEIKVDDGSCLVGTVSIMPADNVNGMRADTLALLKELDAPVYRWPGGNFVSGYDWRDGIGVRDKRPPRTNPAWTGVEHNDFGMHEFIDFCNIVGAEPFIAVNTGFGDAYSAAAELEYANGSVSTPMGALRKVNGSAKPFDVRLWCVGNEMWGDWQLGYMSLDDYVLKHNIVEQKMREVDPTITTVGSGDIGDAGPKSWSRGMLTNCADHMDHLSEHFYVTDTLTNVAEHVAQVPAAIKRIADAHREFRQSIPALKGKDIRIALDEWNYWNYNPGEGDRLKPVDAYWYGELGRRYSFQDGLGIAAGLHEYFRNSDIMFMANYAQTINVIGCIKTTKTAAEFETTALPLALYRKAFGTIPVAVTHSAQPLDISAALTEDGKEITIAVVNPTSSAYELTLDVAAAKPTAAAKTWIIAHNDPMAYNQPGEPRRIDIVEGPKADLTKAVRVRPLSVTLFRAPI